MKEIDKNKYWEEQKCLSKICKNRPLKTSEIFQWNSFYGMDKIIKEYLGLPIEYSLKGVWPHGISYDSDRVNKSEKETNLPVVFCYPPYRVPAYEENTDKLVIPAAHPFLYLLKETEPVGVERQGTIVFPQHSVEGIEAEMDYQALADRLVSLQDEYQPVTVCLYWKDYNLGRAAPFRERGLPVVSAGHRHDPEFFYRFYSLCACHEYSAGNGIGGHIFYSVAAGCSYFHLEHIGYELKGDKDRIDEDMRKWTSDEIERRVESTFFNTKPTEKKLQQKEAKFFLGNSYVKSRKELAKDLAFSELSDKLPIRKNEKYSKPFFWERSKREIARKASATLGNLKRVYEK